ncbi:ribonuclease T [Octadecabacter sp. R77987]|uniref:ribonuclease T2 family protein n=1 Tax=Octadecabacter sp. R77987 TaxID=3093874 RepID=UPI00366D6B57
MLRYLLPLLLSSSLARADGTAGEFDYYVISLSWSPNWCALEGDARGSPQCDADADFGWVLHGLWPQYERGWPDYCPTVHRNPSRGDTADQADIFGSSGSAWHQWNKHGRCSGLSADDYYALARIAYDQITRPAVLRDLDRDVTLPAALIEQAFLRDNPGLSGDMITITCRAGQIQEARICLTRDLEPRVCGADVIRDCTLDNAFFAPIR